jgi:hypothetical protein
MPLKLRADSLEYVTATLSTDHDITGDVIAVALPTSGAAPSTWVPATVLDVTEVPPSSGRWTARYRILIGPGSPDISLAVGEYDWTVRLTDDPEAPVRLVDKIIVSTTGV